MERIKEGKRKGKNKEEKGNGRKEGRKEKKEARTESQVSGEIGTDDTVARGQKWRTDPLWLSSIPILLLWTSSLTSLLLSVLFINLCVFSFSISFALRSY